MGNHKLFVDPPGRRQDSATALGEVDGSLGNDEAGSEDVLGGGLGGDDGRW